MDLRARLGRLTRDAGTQPAPLDEPSLADRIARLRRTESAKPDGAAVARLLGGEVIADGLIAIERVLPLEQPHGRDRLGLLEGAPLGALAEGVPPIEGLLFLDTETTGLSGGTGTVAFLVGLARIECACLRVRQLFLTGFRGEAALLEETAAWAREAAGIVSFNGKCFDLPLLESRFRLARMPVPFGGLSHLDLLHPTRAAFSTRWPDCRLQTAEARLLGFLREDDLPGHLMPQAWFDFARLGDTRRLPGVILHNRLDVASLAALLGALAWAYAEGAHGADPLALARHHLRAGREESAYGRLSGDADSLGDAGLLELARLHRRRGEWDEAAAIWRRLAERDVIEALERLAKYEEHLRRDIAAARAHAGRLLALEPRNPRHARRAARLAGKSERPEGLLQAVPPTP